MAALEVRNLHAGYTDTTVLRGLSLTIPRGKLTALIGPNGAGKSTLLKVMSGLLQPTSGSVELFGQDVSRLTPHRRTALGICHIPEGRAIYRHLTVRENLILQSVKGEEKQSLERAFTALPRLAERRNQRAGTLSGGEQQMLAMARAFIHEQRVVLVDEPSLGLAPMIVDSIFGFLGNELVAQSGTSVLIVDQFVHRLLSMADVAYVMRRGEIVFGGDADQLRGSDIFARYVSSGTLA